ncbi:sugar-binding transcriptional regulator [Caldilinea sp.]|jgi:DNA-binding transcriptional regulator LsrR (DeoR family)|uniref:sugar-binding transcriptional regulator n=1 Tax=Caldilinea sp. TaxID=2293560 RepID=UPI0021DEBB6F|nr:sugar-binding domain-containing protein [Caldilinea sp.]GIV67223.1 MAG: DNA-binding transcriptional regulator [Caldilinea sp.]
MMVHRHTGDDAIDNLDLLIEVAEKYYVDQLTQAQIAELYHISRSTVSRLLSKAREEGIVRIQIVRPKVRQSHLERRLREQFGLQEAIVIDVQQYPNQAEELRRLVGVEAAPFVDPLIKPNMLVGVGRGRTLAELAYGLSKLATPRNITLVQLLGDIDIKHSLARGAEITRILCEGYAGAGYFLNAPALVPDRQLAQLLLQSSNIQQVSAFYDRLDLALVGIGALHNSPLVLAGLLDEPEITRLAEAGAVGDICGHFYTVQGELVDDAYPGVSIGIRWEQLLACPQLVVIATGPEKVAPILGLLRIQMIDVLITDAWTAEQVLHAAQEM